MQDCKRITTCKLTAVLLWMLQMVVLRMARENVYMLQEDSPDK